MEATLLRTSCLRSSPQKQVSRCQKVLELILKQIPRHYTSLNMYSNINLKKNIFVITTETQKFKINFENFNFNSLNELTFGQLINSEASAEQFVL
jgi:hypothetical protein